MYKYTIQYKNKKQDSEDPWQDWKRVTSRAEAAGELTFLELYFHGLVWRAVDDRDRPVDFSKLLEIDDDWAIRGF